MKDIEIVLREHIGKNKNSFDVILNSLVLTLPVLEQAMRGEECTEEARMVVKQIMTKLEKIV